VIPLHTGLIMRACDSDGQLSLCPAYFGECATLARLSLFASGGFSFRVGKSSHGDGRDIAGLFLHCVVEGLARLLEA